MSQLVAAPCHTCKCTTEWKASQYIHELSWVGKYVYDILPALECTQCGTIVPVNQFPQYQERGRFALPV